MDHPSPENANNMSNNSNTTTTISEGNELLGRENLQKIVQENEYHVEEWYPLVEEFTFPTVFLDLTVAEAKNFVSYINLSITDTTSPDGRKFVCNKQRATELRQAKKDLEKKIDSGMKSVNSTSGCFVRISTRSPKDAATSKIYDIYLSERESLQKSEGFPQNPVTDKIAYTRANVRVLCVKTGDEAVNLMINSNRIREDLQALCKITKLENSEVLTRIVVRKWVDILPEYEFRCFIYDKKITAITQYYKSTYVPKMALMKETLQNRMITFFEKHLKSRIPVTNYVLDFALIPEPQNGSDGIWVVEINNPPPVAGQALFDWENEKDRQIIEGKSPFEFRILTEPPSNPLADVQAFLDSEKEKREKKKTVKNRKGSF